MLGNSDRDWTIDDNAMKTHTTSYYNELFHLESQTFQSLRNVSYSSLQMNNMTLFVIQIQCDELHVVFFQMKSWKSPSIDDLHSNVFQKYWQTVKDALLLLFSIIFEMGVFLLL